MVWLALWLIIVFCRLGFLIQYRDKLENRLTQLAVLAVVLCLAFSIIATIVGYRADVTAAMSHEYPLAVTVEGEPALCINKIGADRYYHWYRVEGGEKTGGNTLETNVSIAYSDKSSMKTYQSVYRNWFARDYMWLFGIDAHDRVNYAPTFTILKDTTIARCSF